MSETTQTYTGDHGSDVPPEPTAEPVKAPGEVPPRDALDVVKETRENAGECKPALLKELWAGLDKMEWDLSTAIKLAEDALGNIQIVQNRLRALRGVCK